MTEDATAMRETPPLSVVPLEDEPEEADESDALPIAPSRSQEAMKQLLCGGLAGSVAKTVTAPLSRLTILFQVHSLVTTKEHRPQFAESMSHGIRKIIERGGLLALWRGNMTSVLHRFPYSAINFYVYEHTLDILSSSSDAASDAAIANTSSRQAVPITASSTPSNCLHPRESIRQADETHETSRQLVRRVSKICLMDDEEEDDDFDELDGEHDSPSHNHHRAPLRPRDTSAVHKFTAGALAGVTAVTACYPLDLVRTRLSTEFEGREHYRGIPDAFSKIYRTEGVRGFYSGILPTLLVAVPNFAISYTTYGTLKEYMMDDDLFYNLRRVDAESGEAKLGFLLTVACGAASGILATLITFPMDTIRRRMQVQNLHVPLHQRLTSQQQLQHLVYKEGLSSLYRGLTPELFKVVPMVGTMFLVYEQAKEWMNVTPPHRNNR
jgi:Mitochondrial carrier protein